MEGIILFFLIIFFSLRHLFPPFPRIQKRTERGGKNGGEVVDDWGKQFQFAATGVFQVNGVIDRWAIFDEDEH